MQLILAIANRLLNIGHTQGMTFRCQFEEGVGVLIVPNPKLTATAINARPATPTGAARISDKSYSRIPERGFWQPRPYLARDKFEGVL